MTNITILADKFPEEGTRGVQVVFTDEDGVAVTPGTVQWWLTDTGGNIINSRGTVNGTVSPGTLASTMTFVLSGDDLALTAGAPSLERVLSVRYWFDSDLGTNLPNNVEARFEIEPLLVVT